MSEIVLGFRSYQSIWAVGRRLVVLCAGLAALPSPTLEAHQAQSVTWVEVVEAAGPAVVVVETDKGQGSGFFVKGDGTLVTNNHVVREATEVLVKSASGELYRRAFVLALDETKDLAVLRVAAADVPFLPLGNSNELKVGEEVILLGAPQGLEQSVSNGLVSSIRLTKRGVRIIQTTAPASPGSSGGPILNSRGEAVGGISFSFVPGQNLNFAVPINYVRGILDTLRRRQSQGKRLGRPRAAVDAARIALLRAQGHSWAAISQQTGLSKGTAQRAFYSLPRNLSAAALVRA